MKFLVAISFIFILISCTENRIDSEYIKLNFEKDLIPEGIAIDPESETIFLNSLTKAKIVKCNQDGSNPQDFIKSGEFGYLPGFGMTIKDNTLYALGNNLPKETNSSVLLMLDTRTGELTNKYTINDTTFIYLNDLAVSSKKEVFITDSNSNKIYIISNDQLEVFYESDEIKYPNGIAISEDDQYLYIASFRKGIRVLDLKSKKVLNEANLKFGGLDGLKYYKNNLYGVVNARRDKKNNGIYKFHLNQDQKSVEKKERLVAFNEEIVVPTTMEIYNGYIYFTIDSQLDNLDQQTIEIVDITKLKDYKILKKNIL